MSRRSSAVVASLVLALASRAVAQAPAESAEPVATFTDAETGRSVRYVSGGIGVESRERLKAQASSFSTRFLFADAKGHLVANLTVVVRDAAGKVALRVGACDPWLLADLPKGDYRVEATYRDATRARSFTVGAARSVVALTFPPAE